jgi:hypothetical protein
VQNSAANRRLTSDSVALLTASVPAPQSTFSTTVCNDSVDVICTVASLYSAGVCASVAVGICTYLFKNTYATKACLAAATYVCGKGTTESIAACEQQMEAKICTPTCPLGQQSCNGTCCDFCETCDQDSGVCIQMDCPPYEGRQQVCCSQATGSMCCGPGQNCTDGICVSPNPGCVGATCNAFVECSSNPDCVCGTVAEGGGLCVPGSTSCAGLAPCSSSGDCPGGTLCLIDTCCGAGVCVPTSLLCPPQNSASPSLRLEQQTSGPTIGHR